MLAAAVTVTTAPGAGAASSRHVTPQQFRALAAAGSTGEGPTLKSLTLSHTVVDVTERNRAVLVTAHLADPDGVNAVMTSDKTPPLVRFELEGCCEDIVELALLPGDDPADGRWSGATRFSHYCCGLGSTPVIVTGLYAEDTAGNRTVIETTVKDPKPPLGQRVMILDKAISIFSLDLAERHMTYAGAAVIGGYLGDDSMQNLAAAPVRIHQRPHGGTAWTYLKTVWTDADGAFSLTVRPSANTDYLARYPGSAIRTPALSEPLTVFVHTLVTAVSSGRERLTVDGNVAPNKAGQAIRLQRRQSDGTWTTVALSLIRTSGRYTLTAHSPAGVSTYRVYKSGDATHAGGYSREFRVSVAATTQAVV